jgi:hypothetical protein
MRDLDEPIPIGVWIHMSLPAFPTFIGITYVDPEAGLSARGGPREDPNSAEAPLMTVRLPMPGASWTALTDDEISRLRLPSSHTWLRFYGAQPMPGTQWAAWRRHPKLLGRIHPDHPDDLQVVVHDGGPRLSRNRAELVWVRITGAEGEVFRGQVLNQPHNLKTVRRGQEVQFVVPSGGQHPLQVTEKYLRERVDWIVRPCNKCGLSELFDAPFDLIPKIFPNRPEGAVIGVFTTFCAHCGGLQIAEQKSITTGVGELAPGLAPPRKAWWKFWN